MPDVRKRVVVDSGPIIVLFDPTPTTSRRCKGRGTFINFFLA
jgi:hypothetical protein